MEVFFTLFFNLLPLYGLIALGFIGGRYCGVDRNSLANFAIFILMPAVAIGYVAQLELQPSYLLLPLFYFALSVVVGSLFLKIGRLIYGDSRANLMALCSSMGNTGYFGLPLVLMLFDEKLIAIYIFTMMGGGIYESTMGYYIAARGQFDVRQSLIKVAKFPLLYGILFGFILNFSGVELPEQALLYWGYFKGSYIIVGMMIIGIALASVSGFKIGWRFMGAALGGKIVIMPLIVFGTIFLDKNIFNLFSNDIHNALFIMSIVPPAANVAAYASQMDIHPEKAATTVLLSTIFALFYIPAVVILMGIS